MSNSETTEGYLPEALDLYSKETLDALKANGFEIYLGPNKEVMARSTPTGVNFTIEAAVERLPALDDAAKLLKEMRDESTRK